MAYSFDDANAAERHTTQYFEMFVNRGIYHQGWTAVTRHSTPWVMAELPAIDADVWELYGAGRLDTGAQPRGRTTREAGPPPASVPERGDEVQRAAARRPARGALQPRHGRSAAAHPRKSPGPVRRAWAGCTENSILRLKNKSHAITADLVIPDGGATGVIVAQGGAFGGWTSVRPTRAGPPTATTCSGSNASRSYGTDPIPAGDHQVRVEFAYDGGGLGQGRHGDLFVDGSQVGEGRVDATVPMAFSADETMRRWKRHGDAGHGRHPEGRDRVQRADPWVELDIGDDAEDADHLISPEERYRRRDGPPVAGRPVPVIGA